MGLLALGSLTGRRVACTAYVLLVRRTLLGVASAFYRLGKRSAARAKREQIRPDRTPTGLARCVRRGVRAIIPGDLQEVTGLYTYIAMVQIIVSVALTVLVLVQSRGEGFSGTFSSDSSIFRTRRGVEKTLFQLTIGVAVVFVLVSIVSVLAAKA